jgi:YD repeat-containing protein
MAKCLFARRKVSRLTWVTVIPKPGHLGKRELVWDALGRLIEVREESRPLARYQYDHRGLRIGKQVEKQTTQTTTTHTLYDESRQPLAELNAQGRITRQYTTANATTTPSTASTSRPTRSARRMGRIRMRMWRSIRSRTSTRMG